MIPYRLFEAHMRGVRGHIASPSLPPYYCYRCGLRLEELCIGVIEPQGATVLRCSKPNGCGRSFYTLTNGALVERAPMNEESGGE